MKSSKKGFTLVELVIVLVIIISTVIGFTGGIIIGEDAGYTNAELKCDSLIHDTLISNAQDWKYKYYDLEAEYIRLDLDYKLLNSTVLAETDSAYNAALNANAKAYFEQRGIGVTDSVYTSSPTGDLK